MRRRGEHDGSCDAVRAALERAGVPISVYKLQLATGRYVVSYVDGTGQRRDYGFTNDLEEAHGWVTKIRANPMWDAAKIRERRAPAQAPGG